MSRQQRRNEERLRHKLVTVDVLSEALHRQEQDVKERYDMLYTLAVVNCLNAKPFGFGTKRISEFMRMFFGQVEGLIINTIDPDMLMDTAKALGVYVKHENGHFEIDINKPRRSMRRTNKKAPKINYKSKVV